MRLLHTRKWTFHTREVEEYCILSHRWDEDDQEIHYSDAVAGNWKEGTTGHSKLTGACRVARELGYDWIWIDTCCIKRESDAELSETINSMYQWYAEADLCIAYLVDVPGVEAIDENSEATANEFGSDNGEVAVESEQKEMSATIPDERLSGSKVRHNRQFEHKRSPEEQCKEVDDQRQSSWEQHSDSYDKQVSSSLEHENSLNICSRQPPETDQAELEERYPSMSSEQLESFRKSSWFTRGWTLQEMLAPKAVQFFDQTYNDIGSKLQLADLLSEITGIPTQQIKDPRTIKKACFAQKMSWMSKRVTTRKEDESYCMLGLLDINMALLYGEGPRAFLRLQRHHLDMHNDESIFAWSTDVPGHFGMLADSPLHFQYSSNIRLLPAAALPRRPYAWTQQGVVVHGRRLMFAMQPSACIYLACYNMENKSKQPIGVLLRFSRKAGWRRLRFASMEKGLDVEKSAKLALQKLRAQPVEFTVAQLPPLLLQEHPDLVEMVPSLTSYLPYPATSAHDTPSILRTFIWIICLGLWANFTVYYLQEVAKIMLSALSSSGKIVLCVYTILIAIYVVPGVYLRYVSHTHTEASSFLKTLRKHEAE